VSGACLGPEPDQDWRRARRDASISAKGDRLVATLKDIAAACGVDVSTVSRALRDDPRVASATRALVAASAQQLGYRPNLAARYLQAGRTNTLWFLVQSLDNRRARDPALHAVQIAARMGYDLLIAAYPDGESLRRLLVRLEQGVCDGALVIPTDADSADSGVYDGPLDRGVPLCFIDRWPTRGDYAVVTTDNGVAASALVERLVDSGATRLHIAIGEENTVQCERRAGAIAAAQRLNIPYRCAAAIDDDWRRAPSPLGIVVNDQSSVGNLMSGEEQAGDFCERPVLALFDSWEGDPYPARRVFIAIQDFTTMARRGVERVVAAVENGQSVAPGIDRVPITTIEVMDSAVGSATG
jgi:DNA-binding LacI/PurR family transcriptional regulator